MGAAFWISRFIVVFLAAFVAIGGAQWLKGHSVMYAVTEGLIWARVSAAVFVAARIYQSRNGQHCALCRDTPETRDGSPR